MKGHPEVIDYLKDLLRGELAARDQYFVHSRRYEDLGLHVLYARINHEMEEETQHADALLRRILFLEGDPDMRPHAFEPGHTVEEMLRKDLDLEYLVRENLAKGIALCERHEDFVSRQVLLTQLAAQAGASGKKVVEMQDVSFRFGERKLIEAFSTTIFRGDRVGLIGANGTGKTTLLKLLLGELQPQVGEVKTGTQLQIAYFDQYRATLREDWNALENVAEGQDFVEINGKRKHVIGYLQDFLFTPERARAPITRLSGGERNRLLLAKLFAQPSNLLVMDEPTNDLDVETLELLEKLLDEYPGTLLLVSHDRDFLDNVVTSTLVMEGDGHVGEYIGGYEDWLRQRAQSGSALPTGTTTLQRTAPAEAAPAQVAAVPAPTPAAPKRKLSYKDQRELDQLPALIDTLETRIAALGPAAGDRWRAAAARRRRGDAGCVRCPCRRRLPGRARQHLAGGALRARSAALAVPWGLGAVSRLRARASGRAGAAAAGCARRVAGRGRLPLSRGNPARPRDRRVRCDRRICADLDARGARGRRAARSGCVGACVAAARGDRRGPGCRVP